MENRLTKGTKVRTLQPTTLDGEWNEPQTRQWGVEGVVLCHHDSHGLCYEVKHADGTIGAYDPDEIEVMS